MAAVARAHSYLHAVAAQVVSEHLMGHHPALRPHRQAPLAAGAWLRPQQEGPKHVSPQQREGTGPGRADGEAEGRTPVWPQLPVAPLGNGITAHGIGNTVPVPEKALYDSMLSDCLN